MVCTSTCEEVDGTFANSHHQLEDVQNAVATSADSSQSVSLALDDDTDSQAATSAQPAMTEEHLYKVDDSGEETLVLQEGDGVRVQAPVQTAGVGLPARPRIRSSSLSNHHFTANTHRLAFNEKQREIRDKIPQTQEENQLLPAKDRVCEEYELRPPDGGWGWVILLGTVIVNTLIPGLIKSFGVLFVEFITVFKASPSTVAWIPALTFALYNLLGPLASVISTKVSCRFATCIGGLSAAIGLALSYFATSIEFLYFSYGILGGIGAGMSYTPGVLIVGQYFHKWRGFANGICASGSALGSIILPPLLNCLLTEYGYRGAILIMCGLILNVCVGAALYQPVEWHLKRVPVEKPNTGPEEDLKYGPQDKEFLDCRNNNSFGNAKEYYANAVGAKRIQALRRPMSSPRFPSIIPDGKFGIGAMEEEEEKVLVANAGTATNHQIPPAYPNGASQHGVTFTIGAGPSVANYTSSTTGLGMGSLPGLSLHRSPSQISSISSSSFAYLGTIHHGSINAAYQLNQITGHRDSIAGSRILTTSQISIGQGRRESSHVVMVKHKDGNATSTWKLLFDTSLIRNTVFLIIAFTIVASGIGYTNLLIILPAYANGLGFGRNQYALLLSIIAGADLVGRISGATLSDLTSFPCKYIYMGGFVVSGLALIIMPQHSSYEWIAGCCALFGLSSGIYIGLMAVLLVNHLGADNLASSFGLSLALNGVVMMAGPPIVGSIREMIGSYEPVIIILGVVILSGGLVFILEPLATRYEKRKILNTDASMATVTTQVSL